ncbi:MAG: hypothetical protein IANPNBLG_04000 [Bryobacteraceae bacterium]|nr:hypothetical protein [Bryobacteraceae bacterium]
MILLAVLLAAAGPAPFHFERIVRVPAADFEALPLAVKNRPATVELEYEMRKGGAGVRIAVMPESEVGRFRAGRDPEEVASGTFEKSGRLKFHVSTPGDYVVVVDNRLEPQARATVDVRGVVTYDPGPREARYLSRGRKAVVITLSLGIFVAVAWLAGRRLWGIGLANEEREPPPYV